MDYISRDDAIIEMMDNNVDHAQGTDGREVVQILSDIPVADVAPVVHSEWIYHMSFGVCKKCGYEYEWKGTDAKNYCPNCGAKMDGERKE